MTSTSLQDTSSTTLIDGHASRPSDLAHGSTVSAVGAIGLIEPREALTSSELLGAPACEWLGQFELIYKDAEGRTDRIPWAHEKPCPWLLSWMNVEAPMLVRPGARVAVVGCGLGQDAAALAERGYEVTAFDACPSAIEWAQRLHAGLPIRFCEGNLLNLPARLIRRFDLVVEVNTLQSLPPANRHALAKGMADLLNHTGVLVAICRGRFDSEPLDHLTHPPFGFTPDELLGVMAGVGLAPIRCLDDFMDDSSPPVRRLRGAFQKG